MKKGFFVTFEGAEGSGKSTQIKKAAAYLKSLGCSVMLLREPGGTRVSEAIRKVLLDKELMEMIPEAELLLYLAARAQVVHEKILPALAKGEIVICDRFEDSTLAYQGYGRKMSLEMIKTVSRMLVRGSLVPDLTFLLDIDPGAGMKRGGREDRMERQAISFHQRVRQGFLKLASRDTRRFSVIDATLSREMVAQQIREKLQNALSRR